MILHNAVSYQSPGQQHLAALPQFLTQLMTRDSISKQFSHNFDGEGYYLFYVTFVLTGKVVRKARAHTQTFPPRFGSNRYNHLHHQKTRPAQSNFLKVRGHRNNKIASIRSLNSQWKDSQGCTESNEYQFCCNIIYLLGENTLQHSGSNDQSFAGKKNARQKANQGKRSVHSSNSRVTYLISL